MRQRRWTGRLAHPAVGFTLIEVLSVLAMLTVTIVATSSLIGNGIVGTRMGNWDVIGRNAALREMERLKALRWADLTNPAIVPTNGPITQPDTNGNGIWDTAEAALGGIPSIVGREYVTDYDGNGDGVADSSIKKVTVSVSVYGNTNVLSNLLQPFFDTTAFAGGGGGGGGGSARSVWRLTTLVSQYGLAE